jgi:hypothetical protein
LKKTIIRFGEFFIATDANQSLPGFTLDEKDTPLDSSDDAWVPAIDEQGNRKYTDSYGYGFHAGGIQGKIH